MHIQYVANGSRRNVRDSVGRELVVRGIAREMRSEEPSQDEQTQVTSVHGHAVLDLALQPLEACFALPLVNEIAGESDRAMLDVAVAAEANLVGDPILVATRRGRRATPRTR